MCGHIISSIEMQFVNNILNFCKYCYIQNNGILVYINIIIDVDDWIIRLTDDYYIVLDNKLKEELFKE